MKQGTFYTVLFSLIASFLLVLGLAAVNEFTKPLTERNAALALRKNVLSSFGISYSGDDDAFSKFDALVKFEDKDGTEFYRYRDGDTVFYAARVSGNGLWGIITCVLAVNRDVTRIKGIEILNHNETPGLGGRIEESVYKDQFRNEAVGQDLRIRLTRLGTYDTDHENSSVDGVTGATRTSESMVAIVSKGLAALKKYIGEMP
jgi:Na+-transporting NADH:ubiquinone oxidoreductase subunit C